MSNMNRRLKKVEKALNVDTKEQREKAARAINELLKAEKSSCERYV